MRRLLKMILPILAMYSYNVIYAQATKEVLTNNSVITLHKSGLGKSVIISKINSSDCDFDLSTDKLVQLKKAGIPDEVVTVMLEKQSMSSSTSTITSESKPSYSSSANTKGLKPGIYFHQNTNKFLELEPAGFSQTKEESGILTSLTYGIAKSNRRSTLSGAKANVQIETTNPVFYFIFDKSQQSNFGSQNNWYANATSPNEFVLVKLKLSSSKKSREVITGSYNTWEGFSSGIEDEQKINFKYEKQSEGIYRIIFEEPILPGEYCFIYASSAAVHGAAPFYKVFDFGVSKSN